MDLKEEDLNWFQAQGTSGHVRAKCSTDGWIFFSEGTTKSCDLEPHLILPTSVWKVKGWGRMAYDMCRAERYLMLV